MVKLSQIAKPDCPMDLLILLLSSYDDLSPIESINRIDKMIQVLYELDQFPEAFTYLKTEGKLPKYGPFVESLLDDLEALAECGLIRIQDSMYYPTPFLTQISLIFNISTIQRFQINLIRRMLNDYDLNQLLTIMYHEKLPGEPKHESPSLYKSKNKSDKNQ